MHSSDLSRTRCRIVDGHIWPPGSSQSVLIAQLSVVPNLSKFHSLLNDGEAIFGIGAGWLWKAMCGFGMGNSSNMTLFQIDAAKYDAGLELKGFKL